MLCALLTGRRDYDALFHESAGSRRLVMWHRDQKVVSPSLSAILHGAQDMNKGLPS